MKDGWVRGMAVGAMVGASAMAVCMTMNRDARRKMAGAVNGSAQKLACKAEQLMK